MIPLEIELENFKQHKAFKHTYKTGLTGVFGENGVGKSNFITVAEFFALTGELPSGVEAGNKAALLSWGSTQGSVTFKFQHDKDTYVVKRYLKGRETTLDCIHHVTEQTTQIVGHSAVNARLEEIYGVPVKVVQEQCFVPQGKLDDCINMTHSARMSYFQGMIPGLQRAEILRTLIQEVINKLPVYPDRRKDIDLLTQEIVKGSNELVKIQQDIVIFKDLYKQQEELYKEQEVRQKLISETDFMSKKRTLEKTIEILQKTLLPIKVLEEVPNPESDLQEYAVLKNRLIAAEPFYKKAVEGKCPTCGRDYVFKDQQERQQLIIDYETLRDTIKTFKEQIVQKQEAYKQFVAAQEGLKKAQLQRIKTETDIQHFQKQLESLLTVKYLSQAECDEITQFVKEFHEVKDILTDLKIRHDVGISELKLKKKQLAEFIVEYKRNQKIEAFLKILERARVVLHRDNLPRAILFKLVMAINSRIPIYLNKFNVNFTANLDEHFDFVCTFPAKNITDVSARETLSGGQKVALALAFHFAKSDILGASIPLLVLDEPTAYLNTINKEALCTVFAEARKFAEDGWYVMISTHEEMMESAMTNIVRIV